MRFEQLPPRSIQRLTPLLALLILLVGLVPAPAVTQAAEADGPRAIVHGSVRDAATQAPIAGARVEIRELVLTTGDDGLIPETAIPLAGAIEEVDVSVTADGYGLWRYRGVELKAGHRMELRIELRDRPTLFEPQEVSAAAAPYDGPPEYIRVGRTFNEQCISPPPVVRVDRMPFTDYVKNVLPNEWLRGWPEESLNAGAVAVAQYAWSEAFAKRKWTARGFPFDVVDSTCDQYYRDRNASLDYSRTDAAVSRMWGTALMRDSTFITTYYRAWDSQCPHQDCIGQWETYHRANEGWSGLQILGYYYGRLGPIGHLNTAPSHRALVLYRSRDVAIAPGESATIGVCLHNTGKAEWRGGEAGLSVINPDDSGDGAYRSPVADESWPSPEIAARLDSTARLGDKAMLRFMVAAPAELEPGVYKLTLEPTDGTQAISTDLPLSWSVRVVAPAEPATIDGMEPRVWLPLIASDEDVIPAGCE
jgi:hypothetical protein